MCWCLLPLLVRSSELAAVAAVAAVPAVCGRCPGDPAGLGEPVARGGLVDWITSVITGS
ncbi:exported hypothetical protein [Frankia sp. AiPs1]